MQEGESEAGLILVPFDFVWVSTICKHIWQAAVYERFLEQGGSPPEVSGQGCMSEELCWGEGLAPGSDAAGSGAGGKGESMSQSLPSPVPRHSQGITRCF